MSNAKIKISLNKLFEKNRVIFWYDDKADFINDYDKLVIDGVEKIKVENNEFKIKYIVNKDKPKSKFLLYFNNPRPIDEDNWLLDMELAHYVFTTDMASMYIQDVGMEFHNKEFVTEHLEFFKNAKRRNALKEILDKDDRDRNILYKMLAVLFNTQHISLESFILAYADAFSSGNDKYEKNLLSFNLHDFFWKEITTKYGYVSDTPSIYEFLIEVFGSNCSLCSTSGISRDSKILLSQWKDSVSYNKSFISLSNRIAGDLRIEDLLFDCDIEEIKNQDVFRLFDLKIISSLNISLIENSLSADGVNSIIKERENKFWYNEFVDLYSGIEYASKLLQSISKYSEVEFNSIIEGEEKFTSDLYCIDYFYRKFIYHYRKTNQNRVLSNLANFVEKCYVNNWLFAFNNRWQTMIDKQEQWPVNKAKSQYSFYDTYIKKYVSKKQRVFVVISDALRYECGVELSKSLSAENRFETGVDYMESSLPSYTQLGMAALLPHSNMDIEKGKDSVLVDGMSSIGISGRAKILAENVGARATAIKADDFMKMNSVTDGRAFVKEYDVIYIYHNRIDKIGDDKTSEDKVFEAVEDEIVFLKDIMKKVSNMNGNNIIVTSDHGFLFQYGKVEGYDLSATSVDGDLWKESRRYVIGENIKENNNYKLFKGRDININDDVDIVLPKSINKFKIKGAGAKFVHGGSSLQEIIVPVVTVSKKRRDTISTVDVDIIKSTDRVTTNILPVSFIQTELVSDMVLPHDLRVAIYAEDGELLSDIFEYCFDVKEGSERKREVKHLFNLSSKASGKYKNQRVRLVLEEPVEKTSKWKQYKEYHYTLNISFTNDFDD